MSLDPYLSSEPRPAPIGDGRLEYQSQSIVTDRNLPGVTGNLSV